MSEYIPMDKIRNDSNEKGICILSFDGGGPGTYSQLLIVKEYMSRLAIVLGVDESELYPADSFDLMGGVGFGGIIAFALGHLRMTADEAIDALLAITTTTFPNGPEVKESPDKSLRLLRSSLHDMLETRGVSASAKLYDESSNSRCKVAIYSTTAANVSQPRIFRTYHTRGSGFSPTIVDALCSTISSPPFFPPVKVGPPRREESFVGGPVGTHNPTRELLKEACKIFGNEKRVAQVISLGSGRSSPLDPHDTQPKEMANRMLQALSTDCETVAAELSTRFISVDTYTRLNSNRGMDAPSLNDWSSLAIIERDTVAYLKTQPVIRALKTSVQYVGSRIGTATLGQMNQSGVIMIPVKSPPAVTANFVVRQKEWTIMIDHLSESAFASQRVFAITGMGGCGKTQMAAYFLQEKGYQYTHIIFINASSASSIKADLQAWAQSLGNGHEEDVWEDALRLLAAGSYEGQWILILDNADDPEVDLIQFFPRCYHGTVLVTSRNRDVGNLSNTHHLEIGEMQPNEALSTLLKAAQRQLPFLAEELESAQDLTKMLGNLAVALVQAGNYCQQMSYTDREPLQAFTFKQYKSIFSVQRAELMKTKSPSLDNYQLGAYTALDISYAVLPQDAKEFLHLAASFHYSSIPIVMFETATRKEFTDPSVLIQRPDDHVSLVASMKRLLSNNGEWNEVEVHGIIHALRSFSLIVAASSANLVFLHMHPLVQSWARDTASSHFGVYRRMAMQTLTSCSSDRNLHLYRYLLPHVHDILGEGGLHVNDKFAVGHILKDQGGYEVAAGLLVESLEVTQNISGRDSKEAILVAEFLGSTYFEAGRWKNAEELMLEVLEQRRRLLGYINRDTLVAAGNLASLYQAMGRYTEAEELELEVLGGRRSILGQDDPETVTAGGNLALTYGSLGRYKEAEELEQVVLQQRRKLLGLDHPNTLSAAQNLAMTYKDQGRYKEAEELESIVLEKRRNLMGKDHPQTLSAASGLANTFNLQGRSEEAEGLELEVLEQRKRLFGEDHPDTLAAMETLASTYNDLGRYEEAEILGHGVLERRRRVMGEDHPETIDAVASLALTYNFQDRFVEAEKLEQEVLSKRERLLGRGHPSTLIALGNLASTYSHQDRQDEALVLKLEVLKMRTALLGKEHPDTLQAGASLAYTYRHLDRYEEAERLHLDVLMSRRTLLGNDHPDTITSVANLASVYEYQGRSKEAEKLELEVLERRRRLLGPEHPETLLAMTNLAISYFNQEEWEEARPLLSEAVAGSCRVLGEEHPSTQSRISDLIYIFEQLGMREEAQDMQTLLL